MGFWNRRSSPPEKRSIGHWPEMSLSSLAGNWGRGYQDVEPEIGETSLQSVAYGASARTLASVISELPIDIFRGRGSQRSEVRMPGYLEDPAGDGHGLEDWIFQFLMSQFMRGNAFAQKLDQGPTGMVRQAAWMQPDRVHPYLEDGEAVWLYNGVPVPDRRMLHVRAFPLADTILGMSPVASHATDLGLSITSTRFGKSWFQDGGHPTGILSNSEADMSDDKVSKTAKDRFMAALFGTREPIVLGKGWEYKQVQLAPEESQFLETQGWSEAQCARIFGPGMAELMGYETGGSMTYATVVDRDLALLKYTIGPWIRRTERLLNLFLPRPQYAKLNRDALLETNAFQRWQINNLRLQSGASFINEIRDQEDQKPVEWGNEPFKLGAAPTEEPEDQVDENNNQRQPADAGAGGAQ